MKIGVLVPDRGDRPNFLNHCKWLISNQILQPDYVEIVDYKPISEKPDLTARVRKGFETLQRLGCDCVLIMENDDWYHMDYIYKMFTAWVNHRKPDLLGLSSTTYYHIGKREYRTLTHKKRASLMSTMISCSARIDWPKYDYVFLDLHLWKQWRLSKRTVDFLNPISIGIKHGIGLCGGTGHTTFKYDEQDPEMNWLRSKVDEKSFEFYFHTGRNSDSIDQSEPTNN